MIIFVSFYLPLPYLEPTSYFFSLETVVYLNLRVGRESMNHQVLSDDLKSLRGGGILQDNNNSMSSSPMEYQPIQELDGGGNELTESLMPRMESV
jgi:hypothetical protein